jgi:hypothetical protein
MEKVMALETDWIVKGAVASPIETVLPWLLVRAMPNWLGATLASSGI